MRIYKGRFYVVATVPGLSGFQRWDEREFRIVTGHRAAGRDRVNVVGEWLPQSDERYRVENGRVPEHQPIVTAERVAEFLAENPYGAAVAWERTHERYFNRYARELRAAGRAPAVGMQRS